MSMLCKLCLSARPLSGGLFWWFPIRLNLIWSLNFVDTTEYYNPMIVIKWEKCENAKLKPKQKVEHPLTFLICIAIVTEESWNSFSTGLAGPRMVKPYLEYPLSHYTACRPLITEISPPPPSICQATPGGGERRNHRSLSLRSAFANVRGPGSQRIVIRMFERERTIDQPESAVS